MILPTLGGVPRLGEAPVHAFHIPVMGTGFTVDSPLRVARFGISSVMSIGDDHLLEQIREFWAEACGLAFQPIGVRDPESRVRRIEAYLNLVGEIVARQVEELRATPFSAGSEITKYFEMLPPGPQRSLYLRMKSERDPRIRSRVETELRRLVIPGSADVNIMTKVDGTHWCASRGMEAPVGLAVSALEGFARSRLSSSVVLSAGINRALFDRMRSLDDFRPTTGNPPKKSITLKVSDVRSAMIQGQMLAKKGLWASEFRIESGLNCGGHAFATSGTLLGPVLQELKERRGEMEERFRDLLHKAQRKTGMGLWDPPPFRLSAQGGVGSPTEQAFLRAEYDLSSVGWGTAFLMVPQATSVDARHLRRLAAAGEGDVGLGEGSPLGVPFWGLLDSDAERARHTRIEEGRPGVGCRKGFLRLNSEFSTKPLCEASSNYQSRKLLKVQEEVGSEGDRRRREGTVLSRSCLCEGLAGGSLARLGIRQDVPPAVCCGPSIADFPGVYTLREMVDHIYGRAAIRQVRGRIHMFMREARLYLDVLDDHMKERNLSPVRIRPDQLLAFLDAIARGLAYYQSLVNRLPGKDRAAFMEQLDGLLGAVSVGFEREDLVSSPKVGPARLTFRRGREAWAEGPP